LTIKTHLALAARGIKPVLLLHGLRLAHQVQLDNFVVNGVKALLADVNLLTAGDNDRVDVLASTALKQNKGEISM